MIHGWDVKDPGYEREVGRRQGRGKLWTQSEHTCVWFDLSPRDLKISFVRTRYSYYTRLITVEQKIVFDVLWYGLGKITRDLLY